MTNQEKKNYIKENWRTSSGSRIAEMLRRFWLEEKVDAYDYSRELLK